MIHRAGLHTTEASPNSRTRQAPVRQQDRSPEPDRRAAVCRGLYNRSSAGRPDDRYRSDRDHLRCNLATTRAFSTNIRQLRGLETRYALAGFRIVTSVGTTWSEQRSSVQGTWLYRDVATQGAFGRRCGPLPQSRTRAIGPLRHPYIPTRSGCHAQQDFEPSRPRRHGHECRTPIDARRS